MVSIRGVNVYPVAVESIVREFPEITEFRAVVSRRDALSSLVLEIEVAERVVDRPALAHAVRTQFRDALGLSVPVTIVEPGTLPRFDVKARRFLVHP
jgi:phenylacetate-CoA ligase